QLRAKFIETPLGFQIVAPATPYVAAAGRDQLYFIDTRYDNVSAQHIKNQIERATIPIPDEYTAIDEITATAETRNRKTGETTFVFDPVYARVLFAKGLNRHNPELKLPEYEPAGDWLVTYDLDKITEAHISAGNDLTSRVTKRVNNLHCVPSAMNVESTISVTGATMLMLLGHAIGFGRDTSKEDGETDATESMDKLHWH
ncbi:hypothetical protein N7507_002071, partial [Penicillium longicatenatum]